MKNLNLLSHSELLTKTKSLVEEERRLGLEVLYHLREIERRKIHLERYSSLHEFAVKELRYSDGAAYRRIQAMRLLHDLPEAGAALKTGQVSLSTVSSLQTFFKNEKKLKHEYTRPEKLELLTKIIGKSTRETEALLAEKSPQALVKERERALNENETQVTVVLNQALKDKLTRIKHLVAHKNPNPTYAELLELMADLALKRLDPRERNTREPKDRPASAPKLVPQTVQRSVERPAMRRIRYKNIRYISAATRKLIWQRDQARCQHRNPVTRKRCESTYALQVDHIKPVALGGESHIENLQLLCGAHNRYKNISNYRKGK